MTAVFFQAPAAESSPCPHISIEDNSTKGAQSRPKIFSVLLVRKPSEIERHVLAGGLGGAAPHRPTTPSEPRELSFLVGLHGSGVYQHQGSTNFKGDDDDDDDER